MSIWFVAVTAALVLPLLRARYPPVLDLAQLVGQVRLLGEALGGSGTLRIQWLAPDKIGYFPLAVGWWVGGATWGPRLGLALAIAAGIAAVFLLARRLGAPAEHAALASIFVLARPLHVGLLNFVVGSLPFLLWLDELRRPVVRGQERATALRAFLFGWALYFSHALLLLGAAGVTVIAAVRRRPDWRGLAVRGIALVPALSAGVFWYLGLAAAGWRSRPHWVLSPLDRLLEPRLWRLYLLGSVQGPEEAMLLGALALWALLCLAGARGRIRPEARPLTRFAFCLLAAAWLLPEGFGDTYYFAQRWAPLAAIVGLLALPRARVRPRLAAGFALAVVVSWSAVLGAAWSGFDRQEMRGFDAALEAVPTGVHLLTLDFERLSPRFFVLPFFQMGGYAEIERGAVLAWSFADQPTSPVVHRQLPRRIAWTPRLEIYPQRVRARDFRHFDDVLLHADPALRDRVLGQFPELSTRAGGGFWWLLSVRHDPPQEDADPRRLSGGPG